MISATLSEGERNRWVISGFLINFQEFDFYLEFILWLQKLIVFRTHFVFIEYQLTRME